ncbi:hypothetical protein FZC33_04350 [Labrys sp. KNU-23]|uniref:hypothetical protein n=1 Tax=Labrys sp. KNU-23 TaxID=2789216 RepID=UPI0011EDBE5C|nr:hypothetical protein [Labrys sp. KNU-23]QEN85482.1 hypothetical protein FZC33_04350 [Labrys sp. KNU-23]
MTHPLFSLLRTLDQQHLWYVLDRLAPDSITLTVTADDSRFEIDIYENGRVEYVHVPTGREPGRSSRALEQTLRLLTAAARGAAQPQP